MIRKMVVLLCACAAFLWAGNVVTTQPGEVITTPRSSAAPTQLLFGFATTGGGFDTEITISNTSQDPFGSVAQAGTCTLSFYGPNAPGASTSVSIAAGQQLVFNLSQGGGGIPAAPNFQGYIAASCGFPLGRGTAKVFAAGHLGFSNDAQVITTPRSTANPQFLIFPFFTNQAGFDTGIAISNTSLDPFGTTSKGGTCALYFYGTNAPAVLVTPVISAGNVYAAMASVIAPNFQGYVIAGCNFTGAAGMVFVSDLGATRIALAETPELLLTPSRTSATKPLLFSSVTNQGGMDTGISIANTTHDPFGTVSHSGTCTLNFYGANAPSAYVTPTISAGKVYETLASVVAPGFQGYVIAACGFPLSRGWAFISPSGVTSDGDSETAEIITTPRSTTPTPLLFTAATNWHGSDTNFAISNTSADPLGTSQSSGTCTISYYGAMAGGGNAPPPQTSGTIAAGSQLSFSLSQGNSGQGIAGAPGFRGYVIADCNFPLARGLATVTTAAPSLIIAKTHSGNFTLGQSNAAYTVTVSNASGAGSTDGTVIVTETVPAGLTLALMAGAGWTCPGTLPNNCSRSDPLDGGASYPAITVTVSVAGNATSPQVNAVRVAGGSSATANTTDSTNINTPVTIQTSPAGLRFSVDGGALQTAPQTLNLTQGLHTIAVASTQAGVVGTQYVFTGWSDSGAPSHSITVQASAVTYTASFKTQYLLTTGTNPANGGTVTAGGWYDAGSVVPVAATHATGYLFAYFSGALGGSANPQNLTMNGAKNVIANFQALAPVLNAALTAKANGSMPGQRVWTIRLSNTGAGLASGAQITGVALTQLAGTTCSPAAAPVSTFPIMIGDIAPGANALGAVTLGFGGCPDSTARFSAKVSFSANGGTYTNSTTINNQPK